MRGIRIAALVLGVSLVAGCGLFARPAWKQPPPPAREAPVVQPGKLHRVTLDNGLKILVLEDRRLPKLALGISVRRGAGIEDRGSAGLAAYTADMMQRGAGKASTNPAPSSSRWGMSWRRSAPGGSGSASCMSM